MISAVRATAQARLDENWAANWALGLAIAVGFA